MLQEITVQDLAVPTLTGTQSRDTSNSTGSPPSSPLAGNTARDDGAIRHKSQEADHGRESIIKVYTGNVQSLMPRIDQLKAVIKTLKYDIIALNETWLDTENKHLLAEVQIPGYIIFDNDKPTESKRGGGSIIYVKEELKPILREKQATPTMQMTAIEIRPTATTSLKIVLVYRNGRNTAAEDDALYSVLENTILSHESIIMGDFNLPEIDWNSHLSPAPGSKLLNFISENNLTQLVREPTRGNNILDIVITTDRLVQNLKIREKLGDHKMIEYEIKIQKTHKEQQRKTYNFKLAQFEAFKEELSQTDFLEIFGKANAHECFMAFKNIILEGCQRYIPLKHRSVTNPSWFNNRVKAAISNRENKYQELLADQNNIAARQAHQEACRAVKRTVRTAKREKEVRVARSAKSNPKNFYAYINETRVIRKTVGPLTNSDGDLLTSDGATAQALNTYFCSVFTVEDTNQLPTVEPYPVNGTLETAVFTQREVLQEIKALNIYKSMGPDELHPRVLREMAEEINAPLTHIFNVSLESGIVPDNWKEANVTPIDKGGNIKEIINYRPISLTSIVGRTMEKLIKRRIVGHLEANQLIRNTQHGFRTGRSCLTNLLDFFSTVMDLYDKDKAVDGTYYDLRKAFDTIPHQRLIIQVEAHGIKGKIAAWIRAWLKNRKQRVVINGSQSEWAPVTSGVPQGSVLGPLLFIIYINDIDVGIKGKISKFADDTKLCHDVSKPEDKETVQHDINKLVEWTKKWQMQFNPDKCTVIHFGCHNPNNEYQIEGKTLKSVTQQRDLGIIINKDLKWEKQVEKSCKKANRVLGYISRNFRYKSKDIVLQLYKTLARPHLEYGVQFWSPHLRKDIVKMERIQRKATKMIPELRHKSYEDRLSELNLITLEKRRLRGQLIETFKYRKGITAASPDGLFDRDNNNRTRNNGHKLVVKRFNTTIVGNFFPIKITTAWNNLPENVVSSSSVNTFKKRLDEYWAQHPPRLQ